MERENIFEMEHEVPIRVNLHCPEKECHCSKVMPSSKKCSLDEQKELSDAQSHKINWDVYSSWNRKCEFQPLLPELVLCSLSDLWVSQSLKGSWGLDSLTSGSGMTSQSKDAVLCGRNRKVEESCQSILFGECGLQAYQYFFFNLFRSKPNPTFSVKKRLLEVWVNWHTQTGYIDLEWCLLICVIVT